MEIYITKLNALTKVAKLNFNRKWPGRLIGAGVGAGIGAATGDEDNRVRRAVVGAGAGAIGGNIAIKKVNKYRFNKFLEKERATNKTWRQDARKLINHLKENNITLTRERGPSRAELRPKFIQWVRKGDTAAQSSENNIIKKININREMDGDLNIPTLTRLSHEVGHMDDFKGKDNPLQYITNEQKNNKGVLELERKANSNALNHITGDKQKENFKDLVEPGYKTYIRVHGNLKEKLTGVPSQKHWEV